MTIQLLYYLKLFNPDKTTLYHQIPFFVYANSFKDIVDQVERFVAYDYVQYMRKTHGDFLDLNMVQMKGLKQKQNLNITSKMKTEKDNNKK
jgi:hypothetical protein